MTPLSRLWQRWAPLVRLLLGALALGLGLWGFTLKKPPHSAIDWVNTAFSTLQLLTLQFPRDITDVPWPLNVARFLLPTLAVLETIRLVAGSVLRPIRLALLGVFSRPVLVSVGAGSVGVDVLRQLRERFGARGRARGALTVGLPADAAATLEAEGVPSLELDPADPASWHRLHADKARMVVIAHGDDTANLNAAAAAASVLRMGTRRPRPDLLVLLERVGIADGVEAAAELARSRDAIRYRRLSLIDETVRRLFLDPPQGSSRAGRPAHVAILGYGTTAASVLRNALTLGQDGAGTPPRLTVYADPLLSGRDPLLQPGALPAFLADLRVVPWDELGALPPDLPPDSADEVTQWCVCRSDEAALETALLLLHRTGRVAVQQSRASLFLSDLEAEAEGRLRVIGAVLPKGAMGRILADADDALPRRMHEAYRDALRKAGAQGSAEDWDTLTETLRDSNRAAAWHIPVKLAAAGVTPAEAARAGFAFTPDQVEALAQLEHNRWCADRIVHGWRHAAATNRAARQHRDLVPWDALDAEARQKDRDTVLAIPALLAAAGSPR